MSGVVAPRATRAALGVTALLLSAFASAACGSANDGSNLDGTSDPAAGGGSSAGGGASAGTSATADATGSVPDDGSPGARFVNARQCGLCHNQPGEPPLSGRTTRLAGYAAGIALYAPNLTPDPETGIGAWTDGQLRLAIREGVDREGMVLCPQMQHYREMPDEELEAIIAYLRHMAPVRRSITRSICPPLKG